MGWGCQGERGASKGGIIRGKPRWAMGREPKAGMPREHFPGMSRGGLV